MSKIGAYQPPDKYKNYSRPTSKPLRSHSVYKEKIWTVQEHIYIKLKKVAEFLKSLYPKLTDDFSMNIKVVIEKNLEILIEDLKLMQQSLHKNPDAFNTNKLKTNQHRITEMKNVCDTLQTVRSYEYESKKLSHVKHALHELEHLLQPTSFEISLEKARVKSKSKTHKPISKKTNQTTKLHKPLKEVSKLKKTEAPTRKHKPVEKKASKPQSKAPAKSQHALKAKPTSKPAKTKAPAPKHKPAEKKAIKPQSKAPAKSQHALKAKPTSKPAKTKAPALKHKPAEKKAIKPQSKVPAKSKTALKAKPKPKIKTLHKKALSTKSTSKTHVKKVSKPSLK